VAERPIDRSELYIADELFFTGTAVGVAPVVRVDHRPVKDGAVGPIAGQLRHLYFEAAHGRLRDYRKWLVPVPQRDLEPGNGSGRIEELHTIP
jgi:branched-chain amino acid aminotransferase